MDIRKMSGKLPELLKKYKYAILVLAVGLILMAIPTKTKNEQNGVQNSTTQVQLKDPAQDIKAILSQIQGVGKVEVLLTLKAGEQVVYQTDEDIDSTETGSSIRKETVIITDSNRNQQPIVVQVLSPEYLGAVIVCQGAESASVRLAVMEAVCNATGLGADKISVLKMK